MEPIDIKSIRTERNLSQEQVARELNVTLQTVWRWENKGIPTTGRSLVDIQKWAKRKTK